VTVRLHGYPAGFQSLVGSQNQGASPAELGDVIAPCVDLTEAYLLGKQEGIAAVIAAPVNTINTAFEVPIGEVWRVNGGGCFVTTGAGESLDWTPTIEINGVVMPLETTLAQAASQTRMRSIWARGYIWAQAGHKLGIYITGLVGAPTVSCSYSISRLRA
jgi:hypothetical protein